jgi:c-di-GMP-binding flagellar brake protein YcgR
MSTAPLPEVATPTRPRREHQRLPIRMSAEVHTDDGAVTATTRDLSEGGVGIELGQTLTEGSSITLGFFLVVDDVEEERAPPLWVRGRVVWSGALDDGRAAAGIRFEVITDAQKQWLRQVLAHLTPTAIDR